MNVSRKSFFFKDYYHRILLINFVEKCRAFKTRKKIDGAWIWSQDFQFVRQLRYHAADFVRQVTGALGSNPEEKFFYLLFF